MNTASAQPVIIASLGATALLSSVAALADDAEGGAPGARLGRIIGGSFVAGVALLALAAAEPEMAATLAGLIALTTLMSNRELYPKLVQTLNGK